MSAWFLDSELSTCFFCPKVKRKSSGLATRDYINKFTNILYPFNISTHMIILSGSCAVATYMILDKGKQHPKVANTPFPIKWYVVQANT